MKTVLVLYATREGQTAKVARRLSVHLKNADLDVLVVDAKDSTSVRSLDLAAYDLLAFGGSLHAGRLEKELVEFINDNAERIRSKSRSLFVVLLSAAADESASKESALADARQKIHKQLTVPFDDHELIAGALAYSQYSRPVKWVMQKIAKKVGEDTVTTQDYEFTDWEQVEGYARRLVKKIS